MKSVSGIELALYIFGWTGAVLYSMYCVYLASDSKYLICSFSSDTQM